MPRHVPAPHIDGRMLAALRADAGLTQGALAALAGVTQERVSEWEHGRRRPSRAMLDRVAGALGMPTTALFRELVTLADLRAAAGITQAEVAAAIGMSQRTYSRIESGIRPMEPAVRAPLAKVLGVSQRRLRAALQAADQQQS